MYCPLYCQYGGDGDWAAHRAMVSVAARLHGSAPRSKMARCAARARLDSGIRHFLRRARARASVTPHSPLYFYVMPRVRE